MRIADKLDDLIGNTPLFHLNRLYDAPKARVLAKLECLNPTSIKDRAVKSMVSEAIKRGEIDHDTTVIEASSGNTAIALAQYGAVIGFKVRIYMSDLCSVERRKIICAYGAEVVVTPGIEHTRGAKLRAVAYHENSPQKTFLLNQHGNGDNGLAHELSTGPEIWEQTGGDIDAVIIGLGTCGTFDGISRFIKGKNPNIEIIGFEPESSPVYSGGEQGKHKIIGIGPGFITDNFKRAVNRLDRIVQVPDQQAYNWVRRVAQREGLLIGPSSGASAWVASQLCYSEEYLDKTIICFFYDSGERYLSTEGLFSLDGLEYED